MSGFVDADGVRAKVHANHVGGDPQLRALLVEVCRKHDLDEEAGLDFIVAQLVERLHARDHSRLHGPGHSHGGHGHPHAHTNAHAHRSTGHVAAAGGGASAGSARANTGNGEGGDDNILPKSAGAEDGAPASWDGFERTKEYEEMQAARAYVRHRKQIADVLHCVKTGDVRGVVEILEANPSILGFVLSPCHGKPVKGVHRHAHLPQWGSGVTEAPCTARFFRVYRVAKGYAGNYVSPHFQNDDAHRARVCACVCTRVVCLPLCGAHGADKPHAPVPTGTATKTDGTCCFMELCRRTSLWCAGSSHKRAWTATTTTTMASPPYTGPHTRAMSRSARCWWT